MKLTTNTPGIVNQEDTMEFYSKNTLITVVLPLNQEEIDVLSKIYQKNFIETEENEKLVQSLYDKGIVNFELNITETGKQIINKMLNPGDNPVDMTDFVKNYIKNK